MRLEMVEGRLVRRLEDRSRWVSVEVREVRLCGDREMRPEEVSCSYQD